MSHPTGLIYRKLKDFFRPCRKVEVATWGTMPRISEAIHKFFDTALFQAKVTQDTPRNSAFFAHEAKQQMFCANLTVL
jgi:hypothetical protein